MRITQEDHFKSIARALLKGYFAGLEEAKKARKPFTRQNERSIISLVQRGRNEVKLIKSKATL